jgi:cyclophilin family peptidyl-prolyl cis-trans isomerase
MIKKLTLVAFGALLALAPATAQQPRPDPANTLNIDLKDGRVVVRMRPDLAPRHVERIKTLAQRGFYDGIVFHRVIEGFMAQTGDPTGTGSGGSDLPNLRAEFTPEQYKRGTIGMARTSDPNTANSQWFICYDGCGPLTGQYTIWGEVVSGMELVDKIKKGARGSGAVTDPDKMVRVRLATPAQ